MKNPRKDCIDDDYWMGMYPVTNAQYDVFVQASGYEEKRWWTEGGWEFAQKLEDKKPEVYP